MLHRMEAGGSSKGDCEGYSTPGVTKHQGLTNKKSGPFFGNRAMLVTDNHQAWRPSKG